RSLGPKTPSSPMDTTVCRVCWPGAVTRRCRTVSAPPCPNPEIMCTTCKALVSAMNILCSACCGIDARQFHDVAPAAKDLIKGVSFPDRPGAPLRQFGTQCRLLHEAP